MGNKHSTRFTGLEEDYYIKFCVILKESLDIQLIFENNKQTNKNEEDLFMNKFYDYVFKNEDNYIIRQNIPRFNRSNNNIDILILNFMKLINDSNLLITNSFFSYILSGSFYSSDLESNDYSYYIKIKDILEIVNFNQNQDNQIMNTGVINSYTDYLNHIIKIFNKIFDYKNKEINICFQYYYDLTVHIILMMLIFYSIDLIKGFNDICIGFYKINELHNDELKYIIYLINIANYMILYKINENCNLKKINIIINEPENDVIKSIRIFDHIDQDLKDNLKCYFNKDSILMFNKNIINHVLSIKFPQVNSVCLFFILGKDDFSNYFPEIIENKKYEKRIIVLNKDEQNLIHVHKNFDNYKNVILNILDIKKHEYIQILFHKGFYIHIYKNEVKINLNVEILNIITDELSKEFIENIISLIESLIKTNYKIRLDLDDQINKYFLNSSKQLDMISKNNFDNIKKKKFELYIEGNRKKIIDDFLKEELYIETDTLYLINCDKNISNISYICEDLMIFYPKYFSEIKLSKETFSYLYDNEFFDVEKEFHGYKSFQILKSKCTEEEIYLNKGKIIDTKTIMKIFKVSLIQSIQSLFNNNILLDDDEIFVIYPVFEKIFNNIQFKVKFSNGDNLLYKLPIKDIINQIFKSANGSGLIIFLINSKFSYTYYDYVFRIVKMLLKKYNNLIENELFCSMFNKDSYTMNMHIFSRNEITQDERKKCDFVNLSIHLTNISEKSVLEEFYTCFNIFTDCLSKNFNKRNYYCANFLFYDRKDDNSIPILQLSIMTNNKKKIFYLNYVGFSKKLKDISKYNLINKCLAIISSLYRCHRLSVNLDKFLLKNNKNYINTLNIIFESSDSLKEKVINFNNSNINLLNKSFQNDFIRNNFTIGSIKVVDINLLDIISYVFQNDFKVDNLEVVFEKNLNNLISFEKLMNYISKDKKKKDKTIKNFINKKRKNKITIYFNHNDHVDFIQEIYLMDNFISFLKLFFNFISLKGKALTEIGRDLIENPKYSKIFSFKENKYTSDPYSYLLLIKKKCLCLYLFENIRKKFLSFLLFKRCIRVEMQRTKTSTITFT